MTATTNRTASRATLHTASRRLRAGARGSRAAWPSVPSMAALGAGVALAAFAQTSSYLFSPVVRWTSLTVAAREGLLLPALVVAVAAAAFGRSYRVHGLVIGRLCAGGTFRVLSRQIAGCCAATLAGYVVALTPLAARTAMHADYGAPDLPALLSALTTLASVTVCASVLGAVVASRWMTVLLPLVTFVWLNGGVMLTNTVLTNTGLSALMPAPLWGNDFPMPGTEIVPASSLYRIALFAALGLAALRVGRDVLDDVGRRDRVTDVPLWIGAAVAVAMTVASIVVPMPLVRHDGRTEVCSDASARVTVCVHPADRGLVGVIADTAHRVIALAPLPHVTVAEQFSGAEWRNAEDAAMFPAPAGGAGAESIAAEIRQTMVQSVAGRMRCPAPVVGEGRALSEGENVLSVVQQEILARLGGSTTSGVDVETGETVSRRGGALADALARLDDARFADWFTRHGELLRSCEATEAQVMPGAEG
ncbi:hypothetical protein G1C96_1757 [Bifidobacterium sp. DSM 109958]|uniref:Uncharacterized protein n=1 Tax=Bifidobacterium moraviense TaxID=2675323 RepID=A0A7Y0F4X4_9BIFI|nr:hypothetical protein [Bifidobacterium sp. DSM 109958]NMN01172.1 hypothetical protein [Bifidobacterium sp. DSM 109958]